ncbi:restriction endonuclease subunit S, partial [Pseudomonadales bacterium]|nr:restriction endonuclease subunit S [Pseudomonadales bacterium]
MSSAVPEGWSFTDFGQISSNRKTKFQPEIDSERFVYLGLEHLGVASRKIRDFGNSVDVMSTKTKFYKGDTLFGKLRPYLRKVAYPDFDGICSTDILALSPGKNTDAEFLFYICSSDEFIANAVESSAGNIMPRASWGDLVGFPILYPPLPEQKKIASILTSVDEVIENTQKQINKLQDLKKATMNELLTKGIGHTEFKDSELGRIPKSWEVRPYSDLVTVEMHPISLKDHSYYAPVVVRRRHNGVETRGEKLGSSILVKTQYEALPNTFLISKRQIFHGSCGIVPKDIGENAIISKEYLSLKTNEIMDLRFLNYFSRTENFQNQIVRTTYGVDEEKFVFKDQWWMKEKIVCPSKEEQINICNIVDG